MSPEVKAFIFFGIWFVGAMVWITRIEQARRKRLGPSVAEYIRLFWQLSEEQQEQELAILRDRVKARRAEKP